MRLASFLPLARKIRDSAIWNGAEPFCPRSAWIDLLMMASHSGGYMNGMRVERGQLAASVRFLASRWKWSKSKTHRYLRRLKTGTMIGTLGGTPHMIITIVNYSKYNSEASVSGTPSGTPSGTRAGHERDTSGTKKNKVIRQERKNTTTPSATLNGVAVFCEEFKAKHGRNPILLGPDTKGLQSVAKAIRDEAKLRGIIRKFLDDPDPFLAREGHSGRHLQRRLNSYNGSMASSGSLFRIKNAEHSSEILAHAKRRVQQREQQMEREQGGKVPSHGNGSGTETGNDTGTPPENDTGLDTRETFPADIPW